MSNKAEMINYLSKEIETQTTCMMQFRSRINFTLYIGPFVILGAYIVAEDGDLSALPAILNAKWPIAILGASFLAQGLFCGLIERHSWQQCDKWRALIAELISDEPAKPIPEHRLAFKEYLVYYYVAVYLLLAIEFGSIVAILLTVA